MDPSGILRRAGLLGSVFAVHGVLFAAAFVMKPEHGAPPEKPLMAHFIEAPESPRPLALDPEPAASPPPAFAPRPAAPLPRPRPASAPRPKPTPAALRIETTESAAPASEGAMAALPEPAPEASSEHAASPAGPPGEEGGGGPATGARFDAAHLRNPAPPYPSQSRRLGEEGKVTLRVLVSKAGEALEVQINASSGSDRLDESALKTVRRWKFLPARRGGAPIESWVLVPVLFKLEQ